MGGSPFAERHGIRIARAIAIALIILSIAILASCLPANAAGSGMPWETPLQRILESIEGPVAKVSAVVIIIVTGLSLAFGDMSGGFRKTGAGGVRALDRVRGDLILSVVFLICRRRTHRMKEDCCVS